MTHEVAEVQHEQRQEPGHREAKLMHRITCACGRSGGWYFSKVTMREMFAVHQRAASARDASNAAAGGRNA